MKQKLCVIGAEGFIGSYLSEKLSDDYEIAKVIKGSLDIFNLDAVTKFLKEHRFDIIVNCLTFGGKEKVNSTDQQIMHDNLLFFNNFLFNCNNYSHFINIGSGSEFDTSLNIENAAEIEIFNRTPKQSYSLSKNLIARSIRYNDKFTTLRLFGCFGKHEPDIRLLKRYQNIKTLKLIDRHFDYFSIQDFESVLRFFIFNRLTATDVNCVYEDKQTLSDFLKMYDKIFGRQSTFYVDSVSDLNYTGSSSILSSYSHALKLFGMEDSLRLFYE